MKLASCPYLKCSAVLAAGILAGMGLQSWFAGSGQAHAVQEKNGPSPEEQVRKLKLKLPPVNEPANTFVNAVQVGNLLFVSGTGPGKVDGKAVVGRLGDFPLGTLKVKDGQAAARLVGLQMLSVVKQKLGSLDKVKRLVKTLGMVHATQDFGEHPKVINGFSDLMVEVFGPEAGKGTRSSVGMSSLPGGIPVEIEAIFEVR
ncbi:MAG TPA: RidA family protein [Gemmataceae bacterium]|nr:RidA family protein [Gemmataceae bacterium]